MSLQIKNLKPPFALQTNLLIVFVLFFLLFVTNLVAQPSDPQIKVTIDPSNPGSVATDVTPMGTPFLVCIGTNVKLEAFSSGVGSLNYTWYDVFTNVTIGTGKIFTSQLDEGQYKVRISDLNGQINSSLTVVICKSIALPQNVSITTSTGGNSLCTGSGINLVLTANASASAGIICNPPLFRYEWLKDNVIISGQTGKTLSLANNAANTGVYTVRVYNGCGFNTASLPITISDNAPLGQNIISTDNSNRLCPGGSLTLRATFTGTVEKFEWFRMGNASPIGNEATININSTGVYTVRVSNACGSSTSPPFNVINETAPATVSIITDKDPAPPAVCEGTVIQMAPDPTTATNATLFEWYRNGTLFAPADASGFIMTTESGSYTLRAINKCGFKDSAPVNVFIPTLPVLFVVEPEGPPSLSFTCNPLRISVKLIAKGSNRNLVYEWYKDGILIPSSNDAELIATEPGNYKAKVIAKLPDNTTCGSMESPEIAIYEINTAPPANVSISSGGINTTCNGSLLLTTANAGNGALYTWQKNGQAIDSTLVPLFAATSGGNYSVRVSNACGSSNSSTEINLNIELTPGFVNIETPQGLSRCGGGTLVLRAKANGSNLSYLWYRDNIPFANTKEVTVSLTATYRVKVSNSCGELTSNTVNPRFETAPSINDVTVAIDACTDPPRLSVNTLATGLSYEWFQVGSPNQLVGINSVLVSPQSGSYFVVVRNVCNPAGISSPIINVTQGNNFSQPVIIPGASSTICEGDSVLLRAISLNTGIAYRWFRNGRLIVNAVQNIFYAKESGNYVVETYSPSQNCSRLSAIQPVFIKPNASILIAYTGNLAFCEGDSVLLQARSQDNTYTYRWFDGSSLVKMGNTLVVKKSGIYRVEGTNSCNSKSTRQIEITVGPKIEPEIIFEGGVLKVLTNAKSYQWNLNRLPLLNATSSSLVPLDSGKYSVTILNDLGCQGLSNEIYFPGFYEGISDPVTISPNPNQGVFRIVLVGSNLSNVYLYDNLGNLVTEKSIPRANSIVNQAEIEFRNLSAGFYTLRVQANNQWVIRKIVVQK